MKKLAIAAGLALAALSVGANANTTTNVGTVAVGVPTPFGGYAPVGSFIDDFLFTLPANGGSGYSVLNFAPAGLGGTFNTVFSGMSLFSNADGIAWNGDEALLNTVATGGSSLAMTWGPSTGGNMILQVMGATNGSLGGLYTGAISVSAVPEPGTWGMLATGGLLLGFALRRNRAK